MHRAAAALAIALLAAGCNRADSDRKAAQRIAALEAEVARLQAGGAPAAAPRAKPPELRPFRDATDLVRFPDASDPSFDPARVRPGTYRLAVVQSVNEHLGPRVGYKSAFKQELAVPGKFDDQDRTDRAIEWGTVDWQGGWVSKIAVHLPTEIEVDAKGLSPVKTDWYWQQLGWHKSDPGGDGGFWSWGAGNQESFRQWMEIPTVFQPQHRRGRMYQIEQADPATGFESARGAVRGEGNALALVVEMVKGGYRTTFVLGYQR